MYINKEDIKSTTAARIKKELVKMAAQPWRKISKKAQAFAAAPYGYIKSINGVDVQTGSGELDRLAGDLAAINAAIVRSCRKNNGYCRAVVTCICEKEPRGNLDSGRHYFNVYFVNKEGEMEMLKILGDVARKVMGLGKRDGIDTGFFSSGAIGMSRRLDATDVIFNILKAAGGVYAQF